MGRSVNTLYVEQALLPNGWANNVRIDIDVSGNITTVSPDNSPDSRQGNGQGNGLLSGCLLPGMANLHSHAHQRAMAGLAERAGDSEDSFWTWRTTMYQFLETITPQHLYAIAAQLYLEMLKAGYTRVAEFQYLHHQSSGQHYDNIARMSLSTLAAAREVGIGMTNLPVHYQFGGFGGQAIGAQQRRFANNPEHFLRIVDALMQASQDDANITTGIAAHSLRAVTRETFGEVLAAIGHQAAGLPVHIHISEQSKEVQDCIAWSGARPVEYLYQHFPVNAQWCLIHATHMSDAETRQVAQSGAVVGVCPTTEGNLGDGFFNALPYLAAGGQFGIGSDSHVSVSPSEELRWFEYGQRLLHRTRNRLAGGYRRSTGRTLFERAVEGGARACGHNSGRIEAGQRADFIVLDTTHPLLCERGTDELIDSWIFSGNDNTVRDVYVGGQPVIQQGQHAHQDSIEQRFRATMKTLRGRV